MTDKITIRSPAEGNLHLYESGFWEVSFWDNLTVTPWAPGKRVRRKGTKRLAFPVWLDAATYVPRRAAARRAKP